MVYFSGERNLTVVVKIDRHISDLLYDHDCVIVPEMGGFLASYAPASLHAVQQTLSPPSKKIAFNVYLKHNDGLLAGQITQCESISYGEALKEIKEYVGQYYRELESGKKFVIDQVGIFYMDAERNIQFEPFKNINYRKDSFGFSTIQYVPLPEGDRGKMERTFGMLRPSHEQKKYFRARKKHTTMVNTLLLTGSIVWFCLNVYFVLPLKSNFATLNPFDSIALKERIEKPAPAVIKTQPEATVPAKVETVYINTATPESKVDSVVRSSESLKGTEAKNVHVNYFLIAGAFRSLDNAKRLESELQSQGFANARIIDSEMKLTLVCYEGFSSLEEANAGLDRLKTQKKEGWIYRR